MVRGGREGGRHEHAAGSATHRQCMRKDALGGLGVIHDQHVPLSRRYSSFGDNPPIHRFGARQPIPQRPHRVRQVRGFRSVQVQQRHCAHAESGTRAAEVQSALWRECWCAGAKRAKLEASEGAGGEAKRKTQRGAHLVVVRLQQEPRLVDAHNNAARSTRASCATGSEPNCTARLCADGKWGAVEQVCRRLVSKLSPGHDPRSFVRHRQLAAPLLKIL